MDSNAQFPLEYGNLEGSETGEGFEPYALVEHAQIEGFEQSGFTSNEAVAEQLSDVIPPSHFDHLTSLRYEPAAPAEKPNLAARFSPQTGEISLYPGQSMGERSAVERLSLGVGHQAYEGMQSESPEMAKHWNELHQAGEGRYEQDGTGYVSESAREGAGADFSESYRAYLQNPESLKFYAPEKYAFLQQHFFHGREYEPSFSGRIPIKVLTSEAGKIAAEVGEKVGQGAVSEGVERITRQLGRVIEHLGVDVQDLPHVIQNLLEQGVKLEQIPAEIARGRVR